MTKDSQASNSVPWKTPRTNNSDDDDKGGKPSSWAPWTDLTAAAVPQIARLTLRLVLGVTVALYALNQKHMLPRPLSAVVSKTLFWPTLPITASRRIGKWMTRIDDTVIIGGAPFAFLGLPEKLHDQHGVHGVINMCEEYKGPMQKYADLGMEQLYLPTTDHFEPSFEDLISAVSFIRRHQAQGKSVYVHCRAGHGRSAAAVFAWLIYKDPIVDLEVLNKDFCKLRNVRKSLWKQPSIKELHTRLIRKGTLLDFDDSSATKESPPTPKLVSEVDSDEDL